MYIDPEEVEHYSDPVDKIVTYLFGGLMIFIVIAIILDLSGQMNAVQEDLGSFFFAILNLV